ncbi:MULTISPECIES: hypothetical protein [Nocardiaceae]|uniref:Histone deacetylase n=1 Tax=Rhodococcoides corynebacterioides TaxID=53972 RepID=A0ABS2KTX5_9NOCA|nr:MULTISPECIES: hypothetical protein [Rhodococcus]MBM7415100.1 hypothetical protein [Rhodococcus corynebacterioides]MBP1117562.1 hypothetical protein [Rhodococcus sp. PvP016]
MNRHDLVWYVGYGSNTLPARLDAYLGGSAADSRFGAHAAPRTLSPPREHRWITVPHAVYFAGVSARWTGASAFLSLALSPDSIARAYLLEWSALDHIATVENAQTEQTLDVRASVPTRPGAWSLLPVEVSSEPHRGKYDAALRLNDIDGVPALTLTSSHVREPGVPADGYRDVIAEGLRDNPFGVDPDAYLAAAVERSAFVRR